MQNELTERPQYISRRQAGPSLKRDLHPTDGALKLMADYSKMEAAYERMMATLAGAQIAGIFAEFPRLAEFTFELEATSEYDDSGGSYRAIYAAVSEVKLNSAIPANDGISDDDSHADDIADSIKDALDEDADVLYSAFADKYCFGSVVFTVSRAAILDLLVRDVIEGFEAFCRLFPEYKASVMDPASEGQGKPNAE